MSKRQAVSVKCVMCSDMMTVLIEKPGLVRPSRCQAMCGECGARYAVTVTVPQGVAGSRRVKVDMEAIGRG